MFTQDEFWAQVKEGRNEDCWEWRGRRNRQGYGRFWANGKYQRAHRIAYELAIGPIPDGLDILHTCDNPPCCNPAHLYAGTAKDNMRDILERGRLHKLCAEDVHLVLAYQEIGLTARQIGRLLGIGTDTVSAISCGRIWKNVTQVPWRE